MSWHVQHLCDQMTGFWDKLCDLVASPWYIAQNTFSNYMLLKFCLHQMQYLAFSKRSERPFLAQSNRSFSHIWVNCSCGHCGETRANVGRKTGRIEISVTDGWVINNGDKGGWISNSQTLGDTSDTTSNNGGWGWRAKRGVLILRNVTNVVPGAFLQIWRTASQSKLIKMLQRRLY